LFSLVFAITYDEIQNNDGLLRPGATDVIAGKAHAVNAVSDPLFVVLGTVEELIYGVLQ
jgi:hypothetical protein